MDNFIYEGGERELVLLLRNYMNGTEAELFIENIPIFQPLINFEDNSEEFLEKKALAPKAIPGMLQWMIPETSYNINLKATTLLVLTLLLDINLKFPVASAIVTLKGINLNAIIKLSEQQGEKCIVIEMLKNKKRTVNSKMLVDNNGECVNNHMKCKYNKNGICTITNEQVLMILESLCGKNVLKKFGDSYNYML